MTTKSPQTVLVLLGPTASGKSALAVEIAREVNGVVINCDSMQVYQDLHIITARPDKGEMGDIPHKLYGVVPGSVRCNAAYWTDLAIPEIKQAFDQGQQPILVGGTGFYIKALQEGLSPVPDIPENIRQQGIQMLKEKGNQAFFDALKEQDPKVVEQLDVGDSQRLLRAWEVITHTGKSLYDWQQKHQPKAPTGWHYKIIALMPEREKVYAKVNERFEAMMENGALEEVEKLRAKNLDASLPVMKAHGVPELIRSLEGEISFAQAIEKAQQNTRNYVKRQYTWLRHQLEPDLILKDNVMNSTLLSFLSVTNDATVSI